MYIAGSRIDKLRPLRFIGRSFEELMTFPAKVRQAAGRELLVVQRDGEPTDWKPMTSIGSGVREIRLRDQSGAYRVIYVAKYQNAVCVLHCFEKKSQKTGRRDLDLAIARLRELHRG